MSNKPRIAVVGAGIGGLTLALLLQRAAFTVHIFEAVESIRPLGVGINVQPSAVAELLALGLLEDLDRIGVRTQEVAYFNPQGQKVWGEARGRFAGYPVPQYSIHRGELQVLLLRAVQRRLGVDAVKLGHRVLEIDTDSTTIKVQHGSHVYRENPDIIIGADGIHSILRKQLYPAEGPPCFSGRMLWRATSVAKPFLTGASMAMVGHADQKFVTYPIAPVEKSSGLQCINWIAELRVEQMAPERHDWNKQVNKDVFASAFSAWHFDWLDIPGLIASADAYYEFPMVDRDPLPGWGKHACTLLGDAAHPMYPIGSNGASQAILDAKSLCDCLVQNPDDPLHALRIYEEDRRPKTAAIVLANRGQGPDHCLEVVRQRAPKGFTRLDEVVSEQELLDIAARYKGLVGLEKDRIRSRVQADASLAQIVSSFAESESVMS